VFIGHFACGFAAKRWAPRQSLAVLLLAPALLDVLWPVFVLAGLERFRIAPGATAYTPLVFEHYPWSHSLLMALVWAVLFALIVRRATHDGRGAVVGGALVASHWFLDFVTHAPDMPLWPGGPKLGLGLWNSIPATVVVESILFVAGVVIYLRTTRARGRAGQLALWSLVALLAIIYLANSQGQASPGRTMVVVAAFIGTALILAWAHWIERSREVVA
jgi:membrane-bound metal-dependent hydrolase YbcI (DUF457 family)